MSPVAKASDPIETANKPVFSQPEPAEPGLDAVEFDAVDDIMSRLNPTDVKKATGATMFFCHDCGCEKGLRWRTKPLESSKLLSFLPRNMAATLNPALDNMRNTMPITPRSPLALLMPNQRSNEVLSSPAARKNLALSNNFGGTSTAFILHIHIGSVFVHRQPVGTGEQNFKWLARVACDALARECSAESHAFNAIDLVDEA
jgi:hypothetical protein